MNNQLSNFSNNLMLISRNTTSCTVTETYIQDPTICDTEPDVDQIAQDLYAWLNNQNPDVYYKLTNAGNGTYLINSTIFYSSYLIQETDDGVIITRINC